MKISRLLRVVCATVILWSMSVATNASIIYNINRAVGTGNVKGTIETDGTLGTLTASNILSWSFDLSYDLSYPDPYGYLDTTISSINNNLIVVGASSYLTATPSELFYDYGGGGGGYWEFSGWNGRYGSYANYGYYILGGRPDGFPSPGVNGEFLEVYNAFGQTPYWDLRAYSGVVEITGAAPPVPVPATAWLFGSGLLGLIGVARRKAA